MVKGLSIKFNGYEESIPKILEIIKLDLELKKHERIVLKPSLASENPDDNTSVEFVEPVLKFCMEHKNPGTEIFIAEGCDGYDTMDKFGELGYRKLAEKYGVGLIDLNKSEVEEIENEEFLGFGEIMYPKILKDSFVISLPKLREDWSLGVSASLDNMLGAYPAKHYKGFFSLDKSKIKRFPVKHQIHDIIKCKMPELAVIDASNKGVILAGQPLEMDKQAAKIYGFKSKELPHLKLIEDSMD